MAVNGEPKVSEPKKWGRHEFWGAGFDFDPQWTLSEELKDLQKQLIQLCRTKIRPKAAYYDKYSKFPRESLDALADLGLLGLIVPKEYGGRGEGHLATAMILETIARYGCVSTAMCYAMHLGAVAATLITEKVTPTSKSLLPKLDKEKLIGTLSYSDPSTGGNFWFHLSSKSEVLSKDLLRVLKYASWTTSAGYADWYIIPIPDPNLPKDIENISHMIVFQDEVRAFADEWAAMGLRGNQSGPMVVEGVFKRERIVGHGPGDGKRFFAEVPASVILNFASCWAGVSMGAIDIGKKHVAGKSLGNLGLRLCDIETIQNYFGECTIWAANLRMALYSLSKQLDHATGGGDWTLYEDPVWKPRHGYSFWVDALKYEACVVVRKVTDTMLQACGGTGFKEELGLERLLRDSRAGWVMATSNEFIRLSVGKNVLLGEEAVDIWFKKANHRILHNEVEKLNLEEKKKLAQRLLKDVESEEKVDPNVLDHETDFYNPFNTCKPKWRDQTVVTKDGATHLPGLHPEVSRNLPLVERRELSKRTARFVFALPDLSDHLGMYTGQYLQVRVQEGSRNHLRYFSPVSKPDDFGRLELLLKFESHGFVSNFFRNLKPGDVVEFLGPSGGFELEKNALEQIVLLTSGGGISPAVQVIRQVNSDPEDRTKVQLLHYSENEEELFYREELENAAESDNRISVTFFLGEAPEEWDGEEGYLTFDLLKKYLPAPDCHTIKFVLCGGAPMITSCLLSLRELGFASQNIYIYGAMGTEYLRAIYGRKTELTTHNWNAC